MPATKAVREDVLKFEVQPNTTGQYRTAAVKLYDRSGAAQEAFVIAQKGSTTDEIITFADAYVKSLCVAKWDTNKDGELSVDEAMAVKDVAGLFAGADNLEGSPYPGTNVNALVIPSNVKSIGHNCFYSCYKLKRIVLESETKVQFNRLTFGGQMVLVPVNLMPAYMNTYDDVFFLPLVAINEEFDVKTNVDYAYINGEKISIVLN